MLLQPDAGMVGEKPGWLAKSQWPSLRLSKGATKRPHGKKHQRRPGDAAEKAERKQVPAEGLPAATGEQPDARGGPSHRLPACVRGLGASPSAGARGGVTRSGHVLARACRLRSITLSVGALVAACLPGVPACARIGARGRRGRRGCGRLLERRYFRGTRTGHLADDAPWPAAGIDEANEVGPVLVQHEERRVEDFAGIPAIDPFSTYLLRRQWRQVAVKDIKVHAGPDRADEVQVEDLVCLVAYQLPAGEVLGRIALVLNGDLPRVAGAVDGSDLHVGGAAGRQDVNECDAPRDPGHSRS